MKEALNAADHLAAVVDAWNAFDDDTAVRWETRMQNAISAAECFLRPQLDVESRPPSCNATTRAVGTRALIGCGLPEGHAGRHRDTDGCEWHHIIPPAPRVCP